MAVRGRGAWGRMCEGYMGMATGCSGHAVAA